MLLAALCGCRSTGTPVDPDRAPEDFALAVTVYPPQGVDPEDLPRAQRPAHFLLAADRVLHAAVGPGVDPGQLPPPTRRVDAVELDRLWRLVDESDMLREDNPFAVAAPRLYRRFDTRATALVEVTARGRTRAVAIDLEAEDVDSGAALLLVDRLAALSWIRP